MIKQFSLVFLALAAGCGAKTIGPKELPTPTTPNTVSATPADATRTGGGTSEPVVDAPIAYMLGLMPLKSTGVDVFRGLPTPPRIFICRPVPAFKDNYGITEKVLSEGVLPAIDRLAAKTGLPAIDLHAALSGRAELFPDGIHPNNGGASLIARAVYNEIKTVRN